MRDPNRIPVVLEELEEYWRKNPDLRLTQLMWNLFSDGMSTAGFYNLEEDAVLQTLKEENEDS